jgi:hypothetical protein
MSVLTEYSVDWQHIVVLIYALEHISGDIPTRAQTMDHIRTEGLLQLRPEDHRPYPTATEPSWQTDMAWARKNAVMVGYVNNHEWNSWELARLGREFIRPVLARFCDGSLLAPRCFLFSPQLKRRLDDSYSPSSLDSVAPPKGNRSLPNIDECRALLEEKLRDATIEELATRISGRLGIHIPPTKPSVAFAYHLWRQQLIASL